MTEHSNYVRSANACGKVDWSLNGAVMRWEKLTETERAINCGKAADLLDNRYGSLPGPHRCAWLVDYLRLRSAVVNHEVKCRGAHFVTWVSRAVGSLGSIDARIPHHVDIAHMHFDRFVQVITGGARLERAEFNQSVGFWRDDDNGGPPEPADGADPFSQTGLGDP